MLPRARQCQDQDIRESLCRLRKNWELLSLRSLSAVPSARLVWELCPADGGRGRAPRLDLPALAAIVAWLPLVPDRLVARAVCRLWLQASEHGPARSAWAAIAVQGDGGGETSLIASVGRRKFLVEGGSAALFREQTRQNEPALHGMLLTSGRLHGAPEPVVVLPDGSAACLLDCSPASRSVPDVVLAVYDVGSLTLLGAAPLSQAPHGTSLQRPLSVLSMQSSAGSSVLRQGCVVALERLVAVCSWRLGGGLGEAQLRDAKVEEVCWVMGGGCVLRAASFVGLGPWANVVVLLSGKRSGHTVEIYSRGEDSLIRAGSPPYSAVQTVSVQPALAAGPSLAACDVLLMGGIVLWAKAGARRVDIAILPTEITRVMTDRGASDLEQRDQRLNDVNVLSQAERGPSRGGALAAFSRAKQASRKGALRVKAGDEGGAGLDMEATRWGYLVEGIDEIPGQPDLQVGDIITAISGHSLHGLDGDALNWRFGRSFANGVEITVLPRQYAQEVISMESREVQQSELPDNKPADIAAVTAKAPIVSSSVAVSLFVDLPGRLEACCLVQQQSGSTILVGVADNQLLLIGLQADGQRPSCKVAMRGVAREAWKGPVLCLQALRGSDVLLVGVAKGIFFVRLPGLVTGETLSALPELLSGLKLPPRCTLGSSASVGLSFGVGGTMGWCAANLGGDDGRVDVWRFFRGSQPPFLAFPLASVGALVRKQGAVSDAVSDALDSAGEALEAILAAEGVAALSLAPEETVSEPLRGEALRTWVESLPMSAAEALYKSVDRAEILLSDRARELRRWMRKDVAANEQSMDSAREVLQYIEEVRRLAVWPLQAAFAAPDIDEDADGLARGLEEALEQAVAALADGSASAQALAEAAEFRRQRWLRQRAAAGEG